MDDISATFQDDEFHGLSNFDLELQLFASYTSAMNIQQKVKNIFLLQIVWMMLGLGILSSKRKI